MVPAAAGYGDILIICATCDNVYDQYVINIHPVDSMQTLKLTKRRAASGCRGGWDVNGQTACDVVVACVARCFVRS